jgi:hypothetical protein
LPEIETYRAKRLKLVTLALLLAGGAWAGTLVIRENRWVGWGAIVLLASAALLVLILILTGASLRLGHKGFEFSSIFSRKRVRWDEIEELRLVKRGTSYVIAVNYLRTPNNSLSRALQGMDFPIGNFYRVPLQQLCDTMNKRRDGYLADTRATARAAAPASVPPSAAPTDYASERAARPVLIGFCAAFLVLMLNLLLRVELHLSGGVLSGIIGGAAGLCALAWYLKWVQRPPTSGERWTFLCTYGALIVLAWAVLLKLASAKHGITGPAIAMMALHSAIYIGSAGALITDKRFGRMVASKS